MTCANLIGLDWGTSSLRAYLFGADGNVLARLETAAGIQAITDGGFRQAFESLCSDWLQQTPGLPVIACGMIGSRQGWREAQYAPTPAGFAELAGAMLAIDEAAGRRFRIVPGVCTVGASGTHDVIRGEETQVVGALSRLGLQHATIVLPGTHSKWVRVRDGRIVEFRTYMTGELFAVLARHSILGRLFIEPEGRNTPPGEDRAFLDGLTRANADPGGLTSLLFSVRAEGLFARYDGQALPAYLSGLLIGAEIAHARANHADTPDCDDPTLLVGTDALVERYAVALRLAGIDARSVPDAPVAEGLLALARSAGLIAD
ncbi:MAG: 2-dehydro-3-deoxygalactonokinase [Quisquiliibacterium sp.]